MAQLCKENDADWCKNWLDCLLLGCVLMVSSLVQPGHGAGNCKFCLLGHMVLEPIACGRTCVGMLAALNNQERIAAWCFGI